MSQATTVDRSDSLDNLSPKKRKLVGVDRPDDPLLSRRTSSTYKQRSPTSSLPSTSPRSRTHWNPHSPSRSQNVSLDKRRRVNKSSASPPSKVSFFLTRLRKWCIKWEIARKLLHTSIGFVTLHEWIKGSACPVRISSGLAKALIVITSADLLRFRSPSFAKFYESLLGFLMRPSEKNSWNGVIFYLIGVITSLSTLPLDISVLSILILSWVDTAASTIGRLYGSENNRLPSPPFARRKSIAGFLGALAIGTTTAFTFWSTLASQGAAGPRGFSWQGITRSPMMHREIFDDSIISSIVRKIQLPNPHSSLSLAPLSFACGLVAAISESFDFFGWDDNLVLPILSGWGIWGIMKAFG